MHKILYSNEIDIKKLREENKKLIDKLEDKGSTITSNILSAYFDFIDNLKNFDNIADDLKDFVEKLNLDFDTTPIYIILLSYTLNFLDEYKRENKLGAEPDYEKIKENIKGQRLENRINDTLYSNFMYNKAKLLWNKKVIYLTMADNRVRPEHRKLHGTIFVPAEHPELIPPLGYNCRCFIVEYKR